MRSLVTAPPMRPLLFSLLVLLSIPASQAQSPVSLVVATMPGGRVGVEAQPFDPFSVRLLGSFATDFEYASSISTLSVFYHFAERDGVTPRAGLGVTTLDLTEFVTAGIVIGAEYAPSDRVGMFGEMSVNADFSDGLGTLDTFNQTGIGLRLRL